MTAQKSAAAAEPILFKTPAAWARWLDKHHADTPGVWMRIARVDAESKSVSRSEALEVALCYGWIDGQAKPDDAQHWLQRYTPRSARSIWSKINRDKALALIEAGRMKPAGLAEVARARADGRWDRAYDSPKAATVPEDLQKALDRNRKARAFFATLSGQNRYAVLFRIQTAKKPETRARRIETFVEMLARGETLHP